MSTQSQKTTLWATISLVFYGVFWFYLLLYLSGVLDVRQHGGVYPIAALAATLVAALTSPYRASLRWAYANSADQPPRPPRLTVYAGMAVIWFVVLWLGLRILEWISVSATGGSRWPVSDASGLLVVAGLTIVGTALFALLHLRAYKKLTKQIV